MMIRLHLVVRAQPAIKGVIAGFPPIIASASTRQLKSEPTMDS
jgi:hypothetical protein